VQILTTVPSSIDLSFTTRQRPARVHAYIFLSLEFPIEWVKPSTQLLEETIQQHPSSQTPQVEADNETGMVPSTTTHKECLPDYQTASFRMGSMTNFYSNDKSGETRTPEIPSSWKKGTAPHRITTMLGRWVYRAELSRCYQLGGIARETRGL
jgi:hypothetical protein